MEIRAWFLAAICQAHLIFHPNSFPRHPYAHSNMVFLLAAGLERPKLVNRHWLAIHRDHLLAPAIVVVQRGDLGFRAPEICIRHLLTPLITTPQNKPYYQGHNYRCYNIKYQLIHSLLLPVASSRHCLQRFPSLIVIPGYNIQPVSCTWNLQYIHFSGSWSSIIIGTVMCFSIITLLPEFSYKMYNNQCYQDSNAYTDNYNR